MIIKLKWHDLKPCFSSLSLRVCDFVKWEPCHPMFFVSFFFFLTHHLPWNLRLCLEFMDTSILSSEVVRYIFETVAVVSSLLNLLPSIYSFNCSWLHFCKVDLIVANYKIFVVNARRCVGKKRSLTFRTWTFRGPFVGHNN